MQLALAVTIMLLGVLNLAAQEDRTENWQQDLDYLVTNLKAKHLDPFTIISEEEFDDHAARIAEIIPDLSDSELEVELMSLVASIGDSHTGLKPQTLFQPPYFPLSIRWFPVGYTVMGAPAKYGQIVGHRIVAVDDRPIDEIEDRLMEIEAFENQSWLHYKLPQRLVIPDLLVAAMLIDDREVAVFTLESADGTSVDVEVVAESIGYEVAQPKTLTQARPEWHWFTVLPEHDMLYVQYNRCMTSEQYEINRFVIELMNAVNENEINTVVYDLQYNTGGNSVFGTAMFSRVASVLPKETKVYGIIGRQTFSSGVLNALELRNHYQGTLIGEPSGGGTNHFGDIRFFSLPNSGVAVAYSTKYFENTNNPGHTVHPDITVQPTFEQYVDDEDPYLTTILQHRVGQHPAAAKEE